MIAGDVVPRDSVIVDVIEDRQAGLGGAVDVELGVIGLTGFLVPGLRPGVEAEASRCLIGGRHLFAVRGPEPAVQGLGLEVSAVLAALEVAEPARGPDVGHVLLLDQAVDHVVLLLGLDGHKVHAVLPANVAGVQPVDLLVGVGGRVGAVEVVVVAQSELLWSVGAFLGHR